MKIVLNNDVKGVGKKLEIVEVSEGFARNFLLPRKLASMADNKNINEATTKSQAEKFKRKTEFEAALDIKNIVEKTYIEFKHKVGDAGKLFGSVTEKDIADEVIKKFNFDINKKKICLKDPIKQTGTYTAEIKLYEGVIAKLKIVVVGM
ncbi:MAG: 50S ribosomal protein L9 [Clostridia bacterium]